MAWAQLNSTGTLQTIYSGPVSGISASEHLAQQAGLGNLMASDMGGTSFDIGLVPADGVKHYDFMPTIDRWLVSVPMIHLVTLGAGGGSIASYNRLHQSIQVGPQSAGSDPGPACYDRGGMRATVTDADLLLGYLDPARYADGRIPLNRKRAEFAVDFERFTCALKCPSRRRGDQAGKLRRPEMRLADMKRAGAGSPQGVGVALGRESSNDAE